MIISNFQNIQNVTDLPSMVRYTSIDLNLLLSAINGNIDLVANCSTEIVVVNFLQPNVTYQFVHNLGRIPQGFLNIGMNFSGTVFNGNQNNNIYSFFLQSTGQGTGNVLVF